MDGRRWRPLVRLWRAEDGGISIEAVLWVPMFAFLLVLIADTSFVFFGRAQALRIVQDGNRALSIAGVSDAEEAAAAEAIRSSLVTLAPDAAVSVEVGGGVLTTVATIPVDNLLAVGTLPQLRGFNTVVTAQHYLEPEF